MRATGPLIVLLVILSWTLPEHAEAKTLIPAVDGVLRKTAVPPSSDPVDGLRSKIDGARDTASGVVERVLAPPPDVAVNPPPDVVVNPLPDVVVTSSPENVVVSSPRQSAGKRSGAGAPNTRARSSHRRDKERVESSNRQDRDTRQPDKRDDIHRVASAGNEIHPTEVKGLTLTASRSTLLAITGVYLLTWMAAALFLIGLGALSLLSSRPRFASFSLRA